ncbi:transcription repressor OFP7-like [Neltuma alba]|uniref:transcription repressor OFP7-like n=1 Tax=Neltuma alba TaxID=207710 RepID=UPI0010A4BFBE|nr:transcription repressor OFP7-like [Prosopis alba]
MAKRLKFRICRVFQSCRSKDPSVLPSNPVPCLLPVTPTKPHRSSLRSHVSSAFESVGCGFRPRPTLSEADERRNEPQDFRWEQQDKWHVVAKVCAPDNNTTSRRKIYSSSVSGASDDDDDDILPLPPPRRARKKKGRVKKKKTTPRFRVSTSSADSCGLFSSDGHNDMDEEETETLVSSSRSFSTDSSSVELNSHLGSICETANQHQGVKKTKPKSTKKKKKKCKKKKDGRASFSSSPARVSMLLRLIPCSVEGKVRESFAVVKRSEDPYEDFRRSMMEMVLEKQIFEEADLEQLLHCFLSLNSSEHHGVIVQVFAEIWQALFTSAPTTFRE